LQHGHKLPQRSERGLCTKSKLRYTNHPAFPIAIGDFGRYLAERALRDSVLELKQKMEVASKQT